MFIIDRYLLKQFTQIFVICFLSMTGLFIVIDAFENLDAFSAQAGQEGSLLGIIAKYYAYRSLGIFERTGGILAMLAAMFTVTWLGRHQELTALLAAGISKVRVLKPLLLAVIVISLLGVLNRELLIPQVREQLMHDTKDLGSNAQRDLEAGISHKNDKGFFSPKHNLNIIQPGPRHKMNRLRLCIRSNAGSRQWSFRPAFFHQKR